MNSILRRAFEDYCIRNGDTQEVATDKVMFVDLHCPFRDYQKVIQYIDELDYCVSCNELQHEDHITDVNGIGLLCIDCINDL